MSVGRRRRTGGLDCLTVFISLMHNAGFQTQDLISTRVRLGNSTIISREAFWHQPLHCFES